MNNEKKIQRRESIMRAIKAKLREQGAYLEPELLEKVLSAIDESGDYGYYHVSVSKYPVIAEKFLVLRHFEDQTLNGVACDVRQTGTMVFGNNCFINEDDYVDEESYESLRAFGEITVKDIVRIANDCYAPGLYDQFSPCAVIVRTSRRKHASKHETISRHIKIYAPCFMEVFATEVKNPELIDLTLSMANDKYGIEDADSFEDYARISAKEFTSDILNPILKQLRSEKVIEC